MSPTSTDRRSFGYKLAAELESRGMGARTLAKLLARTYGGSVEDRRRTIIRWLQGVNPGDSNRHMVEDALGVPRDSLKRDEDDEEEDLLAHLSLEDVLSLRIREIVRKELRVS